MIYKIILKNFKSNLKNYLLFFFSEVLSVAMIFSILAIKDILWIWSGNGLLGDYLLQYLLFSISAIVGINVFLMLFSVRYYAKTRLRDYGLFLMLGMRKKMILCSIMAEIGLGWSGSVIVGTGVGYGITVLFRQIIATFYSDSVYEAAISIKTYQYSFVISAVIILFSLIAIFIMLEEKGISSFLSSDDKEERRAGRRYQIIGSIAGIGLFAGSVRYFGLPSYEGFNSSGALTLAGCTVAVFLILMFGGNLFLELVKKRKKLYYKKILGINQFYHRYNSNLMLIFLLSAIQIFSLGNLAVQVTDNIPVTPDDRWYPYDYAWVARTEDDVFAKELVTKYAGKESIVPMVRVTIVYGEQQFGISQETYENMTGNTVGLSGKEVLFVAQGKEAEVAAMEQYFEAGKEVYPIWIGKRKSELEVDIIPEAYDKFSTDYVVTEVRRQPVFGYLGGGWSDHVYVFSDDFFKEKWDLISKKQEEPDCMILMNVPEENQKAFEKELKQYIKKNGIVNESKYGRERILYESPQIKIEKKAENILKITINLFVMVLLNIGSIFIMGMKTSSNLGIFLRKYDFLNSMGMRKKELKKNIGKEILSVLNLPLILSCATGTIFMIRLFLVRKMGLMEILFFMKYYGVIVAVYLLLQILSAWCMKSYLVRRVIQKIG